jgi:hypothetical protein
VIFFASARASAAYLTVSEIFPMETRAMAIAFFYGTGTIVGGFGGPLLFGALIQSGEPGQIFIGYLVGAAVMIFGGIVQATMGVEAAQRDLEDIAPPLSAQAAVPAGAAGRAEEIEEPGEEADPYTIGRDQGRGTEHAPRFERKAPAEDTPTGPASGNRPTGVSDEPCRHLHPLPGGLEPGQGRERVVARARGRADPEPPPGGGRAREVRDRRPARLQVLGPLRFRNALKEGVERGAFRKTGRNRYAPAR